MKTSNFKSLLIFLLVLVVLFWIMPEVKIDKIGKFFERIIQHLSVPLSIALAGYSGKEGLREYLLRKNGNEPDKE